MAVALTGGTRLSLSRNIYSWGPDGQVYGYSTSLRASIANTDGDLSNDPDVIYASQRAVRTVVKFLARNIAHVGIHAFYMKDDKDRDRSVGTAFAHTLNNPNAYLTQYAWLYQMVIDYCKHERYLAEYLMDAEGNWTMVPIPPHQWRFIRNGVGQPEYIDMADGKRHKTTSGRFFWLDRYPDDVDGMAGLIGTLNEMHHGSNYRQRLWKRDARVGTAISRPETAVDWDDEDRQAFFDDIQRSQAGGDMEGRPLLLEDGMTLQRVRNVSPVDAQQLDSIKLSEAQVASAFGVAPVFVGLMDNANYNNVVAFRESLYGDTLGPWFKEISQAINSRLANLIGVNGEFAEFNVGAKLQMSFKDQMNILLRSTGGVPIRGVNEVRRILNEPSLGPEWELPIVPSYIQDDEDNSSGDSDE